MDSGGGMKIKKGKIANHTTSFVHLLLCKKSEDGKKLKMSDF
jgi:hypothetical protein